MMDVGQLNEAFQNFTAASRSLEVYYERLHERIRYLTYELEEKNRQLHSAFTDAEQSKDYLNAVLYSIEEAIIVVDPSSTVTMMNAAAGKLLGQPCEKVKGKNISQLDLHLKGEGSETVLTVGERAYHVIFSQSAVVDAEGEQRGSVILIKDITRLRELESRNERNQRLISMGEMAAKIVHEIRNPLCSIELFSSMLERELSDPQHKNLARGISTGISNLNTILSNMLFFARPHKPLLKLIQLDRVIGDLVAMFRPLTESKGVVLQTALRGCEILGDAELLKQVFMNVVINAVQAMPGGGNVVISMRESSEFVVVEVTDEGSGIPAHLGEKIFDPFFTTKDTGTGLGLAIASRIIENHGGYIRAESRAMKGSTFSIFLPIPEEK